MSTPVNQLQKKPKLKALGYKQCKILKIMIKYNAYILDCFDHKTNVHDADLRNNEGDVYRSLSHQQLQALITRNILDSRDVTHNLEMTLYKYTLKPELIDEVKKSIQYII